jgi:hypothetical protein
VTAELALLRQLDFMQTRSFKSMAAPVFPPVSGLQFDFNCFVKAVGSAKRLLAVQVL